MAKSDGIISLFSGHRSELLLPRSVGPASDITREGRVVTMYLETVGSEGKYRESFLVMFIGVHP